MFDVIVVTIFKDCPCKAHWHCVAEEIFKEIMESKDPTIVSEGEDARAARCRPSRCDASWAPGIYWENWKTRWLDKILITLVGQYLLRWLGGTWGARGACCVTVSPPRNSVIIQHQTLENLEQLTNNAHLRFACWWSHCRWSPLWWRTTGWESPWTCTPGTQHPGCWFGYLKLDFVTQEKRW